MMLRWTGWSVGSSAGPALAAAFWPVGAAAAGPSAAAGALALLALVLCAVAPQPAVPARRAAPSSTAPMPVTAARRPGGEGVVMSVRRRAGAAGSVPAAVVMRLVRTLTTGHRVRQTGGHASHQVL